MKTPCDPNKPRYETFLPLLSGLTLSLLGTMISVATIHGSGIPSENNLLLSLFIIFAIWLVMTCKHFGPSSFNLQRTLMIVVITGIIGVYMFYWVWHADYLTNVPISAINATDNEIPHDTMFHAAIAQGIKNYGIPSLLVNSKFFFNYHFGSHIIMAIISHITNVPVYFSYCYLYPAIFLPLYLYLILSLSVDFKFYKKGSGDLKIPDFLLAMCFITPILFSNGFTRKLANFKICFFISESYMVALIIAMCFFKIVFAMHRKKYFKNVKIAVFFYIVVIPLFIVALSITKISVGFVFCVATVYYLFRNNSSDTKYYALELCYLAIFGATYLLPGRFGGTVSSSTALSTLSFLNFMKSYVATELWGLHIITHYFYSIFFLLIRFNSTSGIVSLITNKRCILEETLIVVCIIGALPGIVLNIATGSAGYFSSIQQIVAVIMLIGFDIPSKVERFLICSFNEVGMLLLASIIACICWNPMRETIRYSTVIINDITHGASIQRENATDPTGYWHELCQILNTVKGHEDDAYIFVDESAKIWNRFSIKSRSLVSSTILYYYPALTGVVTIGVLYSENGELYYNNGMPNNWKVSSDFKSNNPKMTFIGAINKCKADMKKKLIYLHDDKIETIEVMNYANVPDFQEVLP